jgi:hypothetical protein
MPRRVYPEDTTEKRWGPKKRAWMHQQEVQALGGQDRESWTLDDGRHVTYHGATRRPIRAGVRPYLKMRETSAFADVLTPRQLRRGKVRTARAWGRMMDAMEKTGMTMEEFVAGLSPEELVRGKLKDRNGKFTGRPPAWVPHEFHRACIRELMRRGKELWQTNYLVAIEAMTQVAAGKVPGAKVSDRIKAAEFVIERLEGKTPDIVVLAEDSPWKMVIDDIVAQVPDEAITAAKKARHELLGAELEDVVDAEIVEEETPVPPRRRRAAARRADR